MTSLGAHIPLIYHCAMLRDRQRMEGFREAISCVVKPGFKVLELGGGTGVLSFYAAQIASKVYCLEKIQENALAARKFLDMNPNGDRVEVICGDAFEYLPPEPVDVVICEMLHVGMVREHQIEVIESFKTRYLSKFGGKLPRFIPEAFIQAIQPLNYDFNFFGYHATVPLFQEAGSIDAQCKELADPIIFQTEQYKNSLPLDIHFSDKIQIRETDTVNAVRVILKSILAILPEENRAIHWHNHYLVLPLQQRIEVTAGDWITLSLSYRTGCEIQELNDSLDIQKLYIPLSAQIEKIIEVTADSIPLSERREERLPRRTGI